MELLSPSLGLAFWTLFGIIGFYLSVKALLRLTDNPPAERDHRMLWIVIILLLPVVGSLLYLMMGHKESEA